MVKKKKKEEEEEGWGQGLVSEGRPQSPGEHGSEPSEPRERDSGVAAQAVWGPG